MTNFKIIGKFNEDYTNVPDGLYTAHEGCDINCPSGTDLISDRDCLVISVITGITGYGNCLVLQDTQDERLFYLAGHLSCIIIQKGQLVNAGDIIAESGNTGGRTGIIAAHLHTGTYLVETKEIWNKDDTGFYYSNKWLVNQKLAVDPMNHNTKWIGTLK